MNTDDDNFDNIKRSAGGIEGWLINDEGKFLYYAARNCTGKGVIVEIGYRKDRSTFFIGHGSNHGKKIKIYSIDPYIYGTYVEFKKNIKKCGTYRSRYSYC